ncbi:hypothetical protein [Caldibacillus debilis]|uniref:hypothetical protein n=1 Tax=Caldibacillus debilis TaxID=301148 RepID=UPI0023EFDE19|nr:hypothetical protein [Caldibacillus debilis]
MREEKHDAGNSSRPPDTFARGMRPRKSAEGAMKVFAKKVKTEGNRDKNRGQTAAETGTNLKLNAIKKSGMPFHRIGGALVGPMA